MTEPTRPDAATDTDAPAGPTGQPRVDAAFAELDRIESLPPAEQIDGYTDVHRALQATLAELDEER